MRKILVFDVNETLLDLSALAPHFQEAFGDAAVLYQWFHQVIQYAMGLTLANAYKPFGEIAAATLHMVAEGEGVELTDGETQKILKGLRSLPAHPEVADSLALLQAAGFRMVALTNSPPPVVDSQLANAQLQPYFERNFSVDTVRRYKPAPEPYQMVAQEMGVQPADLMMIAAHAWDVGGAMQAGCAAAFIARLGKAPFPLFPRPQISGHNLREVADAIIKSEKGK